MGLGTAGDDIVHPMTSTEMAAGRIADVRTRAAMRRLGRLARKGEELEGDVVGVAEGKAGPIRCVDDPAVFDTEVVELRSKISTDINCLRWMTCRTLICFVDDSELVPRWAGLNQIRNDAVKMNVK